MKEQSPTPSLSLQSCGYLRKFEDIGLFTSRQGRRATSSASFGVTATWRILTLVQPQNPYKRGA